MKAKIFSFITFSIFILIVLSACQGQEQTQKKDVKVEKKEVSTSNSSKAHKTHKQNGLIFGKVKETHNTDNYTYLLMEFQGKEFWVAVPRMDAKVGQELLLYPGTLMENFHSKTLNRTFDQIIFSRGPVSGDQGPMNMGHGQMPAKQMESAHKNVPKIKKENIKLEPAKGENAITIAQAYEKASELNGKKVKLKAKVMKVSQNILGKNWLHCQDGTGSEEKGNFDITVTTKALPKVGQIVLIEGILHKDKDIGAGYFYPVIIEDATIKVVK